MLANLLQCGAREEGKPWRGIWQELQRDPRQLFCRAQLCPKTVSSSWVARVTSVLFAWQHIGNVTAIKEELLLSVNEGELCGPYQRHGVRGW